MTEKSCIQRTSIASKRTNGARESEWKKMTNQNTTSHFRYFPSLLYFDRARNTNGALHFSRSSQFSHLFVFKLVFALRAPIRTLSISTNKSINMQEVCMCLLCCRLSFSLAAVFFRFRRLKIALLLSGNLSPSKSNEWKCRVLTTFNRWNYTF